MDGEQLLPLGEVELVEVFDDLDAGVRNQDVELAEGADRFGHAGFDLLLVGHVHRDADRLRRAAQFLGGCVRAVLIQVGDDDLRAFVDVDGCDFLADAARGSGDDGDFVFEAHGGSF